MGSHQVCSWQWGCPSSVVSQIGPLQWLHISYGLSFRLLTSLSNFLQLLDLFQYCHLAGDGCGRVSLDTRILLPGVKLFWWSFQLFFVSYSYLIATLPRKLVTGHVRLVAKDQVCLLWFFFFLCFFVRPLHTTRCWLQPSFLLRVTSLLLFCGVWEGCLQTPALQMHHSILPSCVCRGGWWRFWGYHK